MKINHPSTTDAFRNLALFILELAGWRGSKSTDHLWRLARRLWRITMDAFFKVYFLGSSAGDFGVECAIGVNPGGKGVIIVSC